nr:MAG TPA: DNA/RNA non-specific endonuclease [Caudoviricetes sp.]
MNREKLLQTLKTVGGWVFVAFCLLLALGAGACVGSLLLVVTAALALPIKPVRGIWDTLLGVQNIPPAIPEEENARWYELKKKSTQKKQRKERENLQNRKIIKPAVIFIVFVISFSMAVANIEPTTTLPSDALISSERTEPPSSETNPAEATEPTTTPTTEPTTEPGTTAPSTEEPTTVPTEPVAVSYSLSDIPAYSGSPYVALNGNVPYFTDSEFTTTSFETYSTLDSLGRCGVAYANVGLETMPTEERGSIGQVKPSGWHTVKYDCVDGKYLYNRCHLIGYQLTAENANTKNLITGTRYLNVQGMLPFENMVADYIKETKNHVLYRVTPVFDGNNLVASGVVMEAESVEDKGDGILFCVFCYNVQPGVSIDYATGDSQLDGTAKNESTTSTTPPAETTAPTTQPETQAPAETQPQGQTYVLNTNTHKFHNPSCSSVKDIKPQNRQDYTGSRSDVIAMGYDPCKRCNP